MSAVKRPLRPAKLNVETTTSSSGRGSSRLINLISSLRTTAYRPAIMFLGGLIMGTGIELFRLTVAVRGQTFFDFVERKDITARWMELSEGEREVLLRKHGKEHLIKGAVS